MRGLRGAVPQLSLLVLAAVLVAVLAASCQSVDSSVPPPPLKEDAGPVPYPDLLRRARQQAQAANEAFYVNRWGDLEEAARGLEQTARFLPKSLEVPEKRKAQLASASAELGQEAAALREAARAQQVDKANDALQKLHLRIRELRPDP